MKKFTAEQFVATLKTYRSQKKLEKVRRYFKSDGENNQIIGVRMKRIFDLAKENTDMPLNEVESLLENPYYEARMGAVSIMDFQARRKTLHKNNIKNCLISTLTATTALTLGILWTGRPNV